MSEPHDATATERYDHLLIGTGQATGTLLAGLPRDADVCVIEGAQVGGSCVNYGCTPTKTLIASAKAAHHARRSETYGVRTGTVEVDGPAVLRRVDRVRSESREGLTRFLETTDRFTLVRGWARFVGPRRVRVGDRTIEGGTVHLNVGTRARAPEVPGLEDVPWLDSRGLLDLPDLPERLIVLGGSYVGLEMAQAYARLGTRVLVLEAGPRVASREDPEISDAVRDVLEGEGVEIRTGVRPTRAEAAAAGVRLRWRADDGTGEDAFGTHLLVAVGRVPHTAELGLDAAGVEVDERGFVTVDARCRTSADGVYALGDVNGRGAFTHTAVHDAEIVLDDLRGAASARTLDDRTTIYALFTDPPLGRWGLTETQAVEAGRRVKVATKAMAKVARAKEEGRTEGTIKLVVDADTDRLIGTATFGLHGDELANLFAAFAAGDRPWTALRRTVLVHPTVGELVPWILDDLEVRPD